MINTNKKSVSVVYVHPQTGYFLLSDSLLRFCLEQDHCGGELEKSRNYFDPFLELAIIPCSNKIHFERMTGSRL